MVKVFDFFRERARIKQEQQKLDIKNEQKDAKRHAETIFVILSEIYESFLKQHEKTSNLLFQIFTQIRKIDIEHPQRVNLKNPCRTVSDIIFPDNLVEIRPLNISLRNVNNDLKLIYVKFEEIRNNTPANKDKTYLGDRVLLILKMYNKVKSELDRALLDFKQKMDKRIHDDRTKRHISYTQQQNTPRIDYEEWKKYVLHLIKSGKPVDEALSITDSVSENITDESGKVTHIVSQFDYNDILDRLEKDLTIDTNMKKELIYGLTHSDLIVSRLAAGEKQKPVIVDRSVYEGIMDRRAQRRNRDERTLRRLPG